MEINKIQQNQPNFQALYTILDPLKYCPRQSQLCILIKEVVYEFTCLASFKK